MGARSQTAYVSPAVLRWARQRSGLTVAGLASRANLKQHKLAAWEEGSEHPTLRQAQHIAGTLHVPFGYFFLERPPDEKIPLHDFRTMGGTTGTRPSPELFDLISDTMFKHGWYREFLEEEGGQPLSFVGRYNRTTPPVTIAEDIRDTVGTIPAMRKESRSWDEFLRSFAKRIEAIGVMVLKSGVVGGNPHRKLDAKEFRGFTIADKIAPLVFVNGADARAAQIFTLAHELAHVWIGASGISNENMAVVTVDAEIERLCNQVAAELLVPAPEFMAVWGRGNLDSNLASLGRAFRVSPLVILRRALDTGVITAKQFQERYGLEERHFQEQEDDRPDGGNFFATLLARNGTRFTRAVLEALGEGKALHREAAQLLNVKVPTLRKVAEFIEASA
jgi:Zn-dependent peptidase ImmA (M78 family)/transcriptional regulator with XRE-family HTH domain